MKEFHTYGPPGTGKTTRLATRDIPRAVAKFGADRIMVVSFTRTAAIKIAAQRSRETGQRINLPRENVGTLHSICYHALHQPQILETEKALIRQFNEENPTFAVTGESISVLDNIRDEGGAGWGGGDHLLNAVNIMRNKMIPVTLWPPKLVKFYRKWHAFKESTNTVDFTDLIDQCIRNVPVAPQRPKVIFVDEAQDMTKLQLALIRSWAFDCEWVILCGDDDQTIFSFAGSSPEALLDPPVADNMKTVLKQSYRVPEEILNRANKLVTKIKHREPKNYHPRRERYPDGPFVKGRVVEDTANWRHPEELIVKVKEKIKDKKTVMIIASCSYMIDPIKKLLRDQGIAFHNPFRKTRGDWNPLGSNGHGVSAKQILVDFISNGMDENFWNIPQFVAWAQFIKVGDTGLKHKVGKAGIKTLKLAIEEKRAGLHTCRNVIGQLMNDTAVEQALKRNVTWLYDNLLSAKQTAIEYPLKVFGQYGLSGVEDTPLVTIGTIHSVKGEEANTTILFPDISWQADEEMQKSEAGRDSVYRVFYVGMTRAREELVICSPATRGGGRQKPKMFVKL